jgi:hypothetical protein
MHLAMCTKTTVPAHRSLLHKNSPFLSLFHPRKSLSSPFTETKAALYVRVEEVVVKITGVKLGLQSTSLSFKGA